MEKDSTARKVIEQMVTQEIGRIASETKDVVREMVRAALLPQLRAAIQDSISQVMREVLTGGMPPVSRDDISEEIPQTPPAFLEGEIQRILAAEEEPVAEEAKGSGNGSGRYVYCIADSGEMVNLGQIGIEGSEVYTIPYNSLCAVVHTCSAEPYTSDDEEVVKGWVQTHQKVLDVAMEKFDVVLPLGLDTIIKGEDTLDPDQVVRDWLRDDSEKLREKMDRVRGKREFGVQVFYDPKVVGETIARDSEEIQKLKVQMAAQKPGMAYVYKRRIEKAVREQMERRAEQHFKDFYGVIVNQADDIKVEKLKRDKEKTMFMNLSCLVLNEKVNGLGNELERIDNMEGFSVRFTGPRAPYSFV